MRRCVLGHCSPRTPMLLSQRHCSLACPHSVPVSWFAVHLSFMRTFPGHSPTKRRGLARLARPISPRGLRPRLARGTIICGMSLQRPGPEPWFYRSRLVRKEKLRILSLGKHCNLYPQEGFLVKEHAPVSWHSFLGSTGLRLAGARKQPPPHATRPTTKRLQILLVRGEPLWEGSAGYFIQMETVERVGKPWQKALKEQNGIYVMKRLFSGCHAETGCDGIIPTTLMIIIKRDVTSPDNKLQI